MGAEGVISRSTGKLGSTHADKNRCWARKNIFLALDQRFWLIIVFVRRQLIVLSTLKLKEMKQRYICSRDKFYWSCIHNFFFFFFYRIYIYIYIGSRFFFFSSLKGKRVLPSSFSSRWIIIPSTPLKLYVSKEQNLGRIYQLRYFNIILTHVVSLNPFTSHS